MEYEMNSAAVASTVYVSISSPMAPFPPFPYCAHLFVLA
ncbi:hypothetical protein ES288_D02G147000v1 [Gossypium darwinii]|uniref:Uncharacterized protein n=2 Tax=Gossypium TaxID=3633 RepID=A0A5D2DGZ6_GOSDA|nr:hypothetical protein ES288_D02G147000v1 [Gossypium darwinii]TYH83752.1 hypothetical protein ES332_D02G152600v1 [Gossypium tomentosum]TYG79546.1 hypothetical protein ES288_D02G147000v1 [Gossypium darwinii]TYG79547.1 hypothetical protein ES288_D02G147000v1 [Gossypium darwinii]TYH83753.1 hypothetical protein ES332_D02G152600v1 [Gossypium tomentosum]